MPGVGYASTITTIRVRGLTDPDIKNLEINDDEINYLLDNTRWEYNDLAIDLMNKLKKLRGDTVYTYPSLPSK